MKKIITLVFAFCLFTSCNKRVVQLPETTNKDITEVVDVSPVYMFYDEETDSVEFNRRNMISATNWLVNIDKRLTLKQILPHLQYLQEKRQGDKKHSFQNYFTCNNTDLKNLSFIKFTDVNYFFEEDYTYESKQPTLLGTIYISSLNSIEIGYSEIGHDYVEGTTTIENLNRYLRRLDDQVELPTQIYFSSDLSFQDYILVKEELLKLQSEHIKILKDELIYN